jgi:hypothetical protein
MSEYVTIEVEYTDTPDVVDLFINQVLTHDEEEIYNSLQEGEIGSPIAQMLFMAVDGIRRLAITEDCLTITREEGMSWESIIDEVRDALRDWYL